MSILLDALKKSEEQRQLGQAPSIHSPAGETSDRGGSGSQWVPLAMMSAAAVAMAWIGWQQFRPPADDAGSAPVAVAASTEAGNDTADTESAAEAAAASGEAPPADTAKPEAAPVARRPQMVAGPAARTPVESMDRRVEELRKATVPPPTDFQDSERQRAEISRSVRDYAPAEDDSAASPTQPVAKAEPRVAQQAAAVEQEPADSAQADAGEPGQAAGDPRETPPISFWGLPQNVRDALPELRITVLVYAEKPENRFVLIEGQRVVEKDQLSDGVVLKEIRRDGAVFEYRGYRFLVEG